MFASNSNNVRSIHSHHGLSLEKVKLEHGILAKPILPPKEDEWDHTTHHSRGDDTAIRPWLGDSAPLREKDEAASPRHGDRNTEPIALRKGSKHVAVVAFVRLCSTQGRGGRLEEYQTSESDTSESAPSA